MIADSTDGGVASTLLGPAADTAAQHNKGWLVQNPFGGTGYLPPLLNAANIMAAAARDPDLQSPLLAIAATAASSSNSSTWPPPINSSSNGALHYVTLVFYSEAEGVAGKAALFALDLLLQQRQRIRQQRQLIQQQRQQRRSRRHSSDSSSSSESESEESFQASSAAAAMAVASSRLQKQQQGGALTQHDVLAEIYKITHPSADTVTSDAASASPGDSKTVAAAVAESNKRRLDCLQLLSWWPALMSAQELLQQSVWGVIQSRIMLMGPGGQTGPPVSVVTVGGGGWRVGDVELE